MDSEINQLFSSCAKALDDIHDKRERIVKASRDTTILSKRLIFALHRWNPRQVRPEDLSQAKQKRDEIVALISSILKNEMHDEDGKLSHAFYKNWRSLAPGVEEFVEAATFLHFLEHSQLMTRQNLNDLFRKEDFVFDVPTIEYVLGLGDLTGELMRACVSSVAKNDDVTSMKTCGLVQQIAVEYPLLENISSGMFRGKADAMKSSVLKMERACYALKIRSVEAENMSIPIEDLLNRMEDLDQDNLVPDNSGGEVKQFEQRRGGDKQFEQKRGEKRHKPSS